MRKEVTKQYQGMVEVRDYEVEQCIQKQENMEITHSGEKMTLTPAELVSQRVNVSQKIQSKVGGKDYYLFGYAWEPDNVEL